jgi:hypothetical protein
MFKIVPVKEPEKPNQSHSNPWAGYRNPKNLLVLTSVLAFIGLVFLVYKLTLGWAIPELSKTKAQVDTQKGELRSLVSRLEDGKTRQNVAQQEIRVLRQANQLLRAEESNRQAELNTLKGELDFYQRLAGTSGSQSGLAVYQMELSETGSQRVFRFVLTLTQNLRRSAITSGKVLIDLEGTMEDRPLSLPWSQITDGSQPEPAFRFKYFQQLDGYFALPAGFQPGRLVISLEVKDQKKPVTREFDWQHLVNPYAQRAERKDQPDEAELEQEVAETTES